MYDVDAPLGESHQHSPYGRDSTFAYCLYTDPTKPAPQSLCIKTYMQQSGYRMLLINNNKNLVYLFIYDSVSTGFVGSFSL